MPSKRIKVRVFRMTWPDEPGQPDELMAGPSMILDEVRACYDLDGAKVEQSAGWLEVPDAE